MFRKILQKLTKNYQQKEKLEYSQTIADCFEEANSEIYVRSHGFLSNRVYDYVAGKDLLIELGQYIMNKYFVKGFQYIGCGDNVVVVKLSEDVVIRFRAPANEEEISTQSVAKSPFIAPIWHEDEYKGVRINFIPFIPSLKTHAIKGLIPKKVAEEYIFRIMHKGFRNDPPLWFYDYMSYDYKFEQLGLLKDGTPVIIDHGAIIEEKRAPDNCSERIKNDKIKCQNVNLSGNEYWDGKWIDEEGLLKINTLLNKPNLLK